MLTAIDLPDIDEENSAVLFPSEISTPPLSGGNSTSPSVGGSETTITRPATKASMATSYPTTYAIPMMAQGHAFGAEKADITEEPLQSPRLMILDTRSITESEVEDLISNVSDSRYVFVEHGITDIIHQYRHVPIIVRVPTKGDQPMSALLDTGADANFIAQSSVDKWNFKARILPKEKQIEFEGLCGLCRPENYVNLEMKFQDTTEFVTESFRVVENENFKLLLGYPTIFKRDLMRDIEIKPAHNQGLPSFGTKPNPGKAWPPQAALRIKTNIQFLTDQVALREAQRAQDRKVAATLMKDVSTAGHRGSSNAGYQSIKAKSSTSINTTWSSSTTTRR